MFVGNIVFLTRPQHSVSTGVDACVCCLNTPSRRLKRSVGFMLPQNRGGAIPVRLFCSTLLVVIWLFLSGHVHVVVVSNTGVRKDDARREGAAGARPQGLRQDMYDVRRRRQRCRRSQTGAGLFASLLNALGE